MSSSEPSVSLNDETEENDEERDGSSVTSVARKTTMTRAT